MTFLARLRALLAPTPPAGCHHHTAEAFAPPVVYYDRTTARWQVQYIGEPVIDGEPDTRTDMAYLRAQDPDFAAVIEQHPELLEETP